jgi:ketosteroid isomerase-like protein
MRSTGGVLLLAVVGVVLSGCNKSTSASADSAAVASSANGKSFDKDAARAEIMRADSAWVRLVQAKNVDSLMPYYASDVVSMSEGTKAVKGTRDLRSAYTEMVKANFRDLAINIDGVEFSDDGRMAYDHGSYSGTMDGPKGKPVKASGNYLNVWKKIGGRWLMVAEISNSSPPGA